MSTTTEEPTDAPTYDFGVPAQRGVFLGLSLSRVGIVGTGLFLMTIAMVAHLPVPLAVFPLLVAVAAAFVRVQGRRLDEWVPTLIGYARLTAAGGRSWRRGLPTGILARPGRPESGGAPVGTSHSLPPNPMLAGVEFTEARVAGVPIGVAVAAERGRLLTAVFSVTGNSCFALLPRADQAMAISSWGSVLSESCLSSNRLRSLQWVERTVPDLAAEAEVWMRDHLDTGSLGGSAFDDYAELIDRLDEVASTHEVYLAVQIHTRASDLADALSVAAPEWAAISHRLAGIGLTPKPLSGSGMAALLKSCADGTAYAGPDPGPGDTVPMATEVAWDHLRVDALYHRVLAVAAWPRVQVGPSWLEPLLVAGSAGSLRTLSVHLHPVAPDVARRKARAAVAATAMDEDSRRKAGFIVGAQHRREAGDAERREAELVSGYGEHAIGAVCMVSAPTLELLDAGTRTLVQGAVQSCLDVRVLYGAQSEGYVAAMPLAALRFSKTVI
ncbi:MAG TPA: SCO6880 family protein [Acidimicrobiales bacterium]|jgi:hypothetical protein|nr:SCO6880 family protein [Acidimicrobiales bacterium]